MKGYPRRLQGLMKRSFASLQELPQGQVELSSSRVLHELRKEPEWESGTTLELTPDTKAARVSKSAIAAMAAGTLLLVFASSLLLHKEPNPESGKIVYHLAGEILMLPDASRIEVRSDSAVAFENTDGGVQVRLDKGAIIVTAAKQPAGRQLTVQTKDLRVSVVGTVFFVSAEAGGSTVAVIEGKVRVRQGELEKPLIAGQQLTTVPRTEPLPVKEDQVALLQQSTKVPEERAAFEVASIRVNPNGGTAPGTRAAGAEPAACQSISQIDPGRFVSRSISVFQLILIANGIRERPVAQVSGLVTGGPSWIKTECFAIEATIPAGPPAYTEEKRNARGNTITVRAPNARLQEMLRNLLADRFKLQVRREAKDMPVYELSVAKGGHKLIPWTEATNPNWTTGWASGYQDKDGGNAANLRGNRATLAILVSLLGQATGRPVLDRADVEGEFNYYFEFAPLEPNQLSPGLDFAAGSSKPSLFVALEKELGLKLEAKRESMEVLTIEHVERPSEN